MFCKIELHPKQLSDDDGIVDLIQRFLCSLELNGQILRDQKVVKGDIYTLYVTFPKEDSFDEKYDGIYVKTLREKINKMFDTVIIPLGENTESSPYCCCTHRTALEMQTYNHDIDSVYICCDCGRPVALYELPFSAENEKEHYAVMNWQENYAAIDMLWLNGLCDRYTGNQMVNVDSALNKQGIEIASYMSKQLGYPVFYHLSCDYGKKIKAQKVGDEQIHICPKCDRLMKRTRFPTYTIDICEDCALSYDAH